MEERDYLDETDWKREWLEIKDEQHLLEKEHASLQDKADNLTRYIKDLETELLRVRTTETASAHALDVLRQELGVELRQSEHPSTLRVRLREASKVQENAALREELDMTVSIIRSCHDIARHADPSDFDDIRDSFGDLRDSVMQMSDYWSERYPKDNDDD